MEDRLTVVGHGREQVEEEDEERTLTEEVCQRREELGQPRTPEPTDVKGEGEGDRVTVMVTGCCTERR